MLRRINRVLLLTAAVLLAICGAIVCVMLTEVKDKSRIENADFVNTTGEKHKKGDAGGSCLHTTMQGYMIKNKPFEPSGNAGVCVSPEREIRNKGAYMKEEKDHAGQ